MMIIMMIMIMTITMKTTITIIIQCTTNNNDNNNNNCEFDGIVFVSSFLVYTQHSKQTRTVISIYL